MSNQDSQALDLTTWIIDRALSGVPPMRRSAYQVADDFIKDKKFKNNNERVASLITWETSKNFTSGFVTGMGGIITLPVAIPAAIGASYAIQARMSGAIARIHGHDLEDDRIRTFVLLTLAGDSAKEVLKQAGVKIGSKVTQKLISQVPGKVLIEINKKIGFRLITKAGEKGVINLMKIVPVVGGAVAGGFDAVSCQAVGRIAHDIFRRNNQE